ncbi:hypothetical protein [Bacillus sp. NPDC093026]|uniref:hypothetical protein n=1 Tax=Bacillus sp. NPDC093026 TaxID=3363948 RepID=UPI0037FEFE43
MCILVAIYMFVDAPKNGKNQWLWSILGLLFGLFTLGIYFIKTKRTGRGWTILLSHNADCCVDWYDSFLSESFMRKGSFF